MSTEKSRIERQSPQQVSGRVIHVRVSNDRLPLRFYPRLIMSISGNFFQEVMYQFKGSYAVSAQIESKTLDLYQDVSYTSM